MLKILISTEDGLNDCEKLERTDVSEYHAFHIRKPNWTLSELRKYLSELPEKWKDIAVLHSHFELINEFNVKGLHLNEFNRSKEISNDLKPYIISTSFHLIEDLLMDTSTYEYVFLSPIYDSISKKEYKSSFGLDDLLQVNKSSHHQIIALGGVDTSKFDECSSLGFSGIGLLGSFWDSDNNV